jgi:predicted O-methyltransferase YrrM
MLSRGLEVLQKEGVRAFIKKSVLYMYFKLLIIIIKCNEAIKRIFFLIKFKILISFINDIYDAVDFVFSFKCCGISIEPAQIRYEITKLLEILADLRPKVVLEIGTAGGGTLFLFTRVADTEAKIISIDLPGGPFGGGYPEWRMRLYRAFSRGKQRIYLIRKDSHDPETLEELKRILGGEKIDFLFIDGDHRYEGVRRDFEMYGPLVRKGGIIAFHDIVPGPSELVGGVPKFWSEIKQNFHYKEFVEDWKQGGYGIGVLYV